MLLNKELLGVIFYFSCSTFQTALLWAVDVTVKLIFKQLGVFKEYLINH